MPSPAELLTELKSLLDRPGTEWVNIAPLRQRLLELGGEAASQAVGMIILASSLALSPGTWTLPLVT